MNYNSPNGIDYSRLINKEAYKNFDELIKCKICFNILINPYDCEGCGNTFCKSCISSLKDKQMPCPMGCTTYEIKPSSYGITSCLSSLKFECVYSSNGCNEVIIYSNVPLHDKECKFIYCQCPNTNCNLQVKRHLLEYHIKKECEHSIFQCENCDDKFSRTDYFLHVDNCKNISQLINCPIIVTDDNMRELVTSVPELGEMSLSSFIKVILLQIAKTNQQNEKKFQSYREEVLAMKEEFVKINNNHIMYVENVNNELEEINEKLSNLEESREKFQNSKDNEVVSSQTTTAFNSTNTLPNTGATRTTSHSSKSLVDVGSNVKKVKLEGNVKKKFSFSRSPLKFDLAEQSPRVICKKYISEFGEVDGVSLRSSNFAQIKTNIKNQDLIIEQLKKLSNKIDTGEKNIISELNSNISKLKLFSQELNEDTKKFSSEVIQENFEKVTKGLDKVL